MIVRLLVLVFTVTLLFEGRIMLTLITHRPGSSVEIAVTGEAGSLEDSSESESTSQSPGDAGTYVPAAQDDSQDASDPVPVTATGTKPDFGLAGLSAMTPVQSAASSGGGSKSGSQDNQKANPEALDSSKLVPLQSVNLDPSSFSTVCFIGDSRMEGFRNTSGITEGTFYTSVGLAISDMNSKNIRTADGLISVYQGLTGEKYSRIYLMLGTNDLGFYEWDRFLSVAQGVLKQFHELQPQALIYVCSVIYVEESKIQRGFEYDNNNNVRKVNGYLMNACENLWYCYYMNFNEIFNNGYGSLIEGASSDGKDRKSVV